MIISTEGDLGDSVYLLGIISQLKDGPHELLLQASGATKAKGPDGIKLLHETFTPLALTQSYIKDCRIANSEPVDWKSAEFRADGYQRGRSLFDAHLTHLISTKGMGHGISAERQWLHDIKPDPRSKGKVVIQRTGRYRNHLFPWKEVVKLYRNRLIFVGAKHEWREFIGHYGYAAYVPTANLLEVAQLIAGSELFMGNQSCGYALAEGLKHNSIQETDLKYPDCIYRRDNAQFCHNGGCVLPPLGDMKAGLVIDPTKADLSQFSTQTAPPGMWQFLSIPPTTDFQNAVTMAMRLPQMEGLSREDVHREVLMANVDRNPGWQQGYMDLRVMCALEQAGLLKEGDRR